MYVQKVPEAMHQCIQSLLFCNTEANHDVSQIFAFARFTVFLSFNHRCLEAQREAAVLDVCWCMPPLSGASVTPHVALVRRQMQFLACACAHGRSLAKVARQKLYKQLSYPCKFQKCVMDDSA